MADVYDVAVIGGGPGGYVAALRAAQLGLKTVCIDEACGAAGKPALGGTCANVGCIPSKALLQSTEYYERAGHEFAAHGIAVEGLAIDVARMQARKRKIVAQSNQGVAYLFKQAGVTSVQGHAAFVNNPVRAGEGWTLNVTGAAGNSELTAKQVVIATGSRVRALSGIACDHKRILDSADALELEAAPPRLAIIGAGVIGLELGSVWRRLGSAVTLLEAAPALLAAADDDVAREARKVFTAQGLAIHTGVSILEARAGRGARGDVSLRYRDAEGREHNAEFDRVIVAVGRQPNTEGLNAAGVGLKLDSRGAVAVDGDCRTSLPGVWAIGDVVRGPMLAHKAEEEGLAVAERIAGHAAEVDFNTVPWVIYTSPEIAWVGATERALKAEGVPCRAGRFPYAANGRARAMGETAGFVKLITHEQSDRLLGVHALGPLASELVAEAALALHFGASAEDLALACHAHPTLSEALREAALAALGRPLHTR